MPYKVGGHGYVIVKKAGTFYGSIDHIAQIAIGLAEHMTTIWMKPEDVTTTELSNILKDTVYKIYGSLDVKKATNDGAIVSLEETSDRVQMTQRQYQVLKNMRIFTETGAYINGNSKTGDDYFKRHIFSGYDKYATGGNYNDLTCIVINSLEGLRAILHFLQTHGMVEESVHAGRCILIGSIQCASDRKTSQVVKELLEELKSYFIKFDILPKTNQRLARRHFIYSYVESLICYDWTEQEEM